MSFRELDIKTEYRSMRDGVVRDFYLPLMREAKLYQRAVGFFSSSALEQYAVGLKSLIDNGGYVQLVASPKLSEEDAEAIKKGYELRESIIERVLIKALDMPESIYAEARLNLLASYIAEGKLDIKIAILEKKSDLGIYHEKLGLLYDFEENVVAFSGSSNETSAAMNLNYEAIDVFCSWKDTEGRVDNKRSAFNTIWNNNEPGVTVLEFPRVKEEIIKKYRQRNIILNPDEEFGEAYIDNPYSKPVCEGAVVPANVKLHDYQIEAIDKWESLGYRGIFDMATGTGKTFTALGALARLCERERGHVAAIIVCPYQHLVEQWVEDLNMFGVKPIIGYSSPEHKGYKKRLKDAVFDYNLGVKRFICFICTNATFKNKDVQEQIRRIKKNSLLIADEAHNFGAGELAGNLDFDYTFRLGLSATIDRHGDEEGTAAIYAFFGEKCIEYSLDRAIAEGKLTPYYYYPVPVNLTEEELEDYVRISRELLQYIKVDKDGRVHMSERGKILALKRARIVAGARNKLGTLKKTIEKYRDDNHMLVYCGTASYSEDEDTEAIRQIDEISKMLGNEMNMKVSQFTSREDMEQRKRLKEVFTEGENLQALIAIKCLDEGVNIPMIKTAFILASTTNPKEYIQRRGRVLRLARGKEYAEVYDFVTLPRRLDTVNSYTEEETRYDMSLIKNELKRIYEFKRLSLNPYDSDDLIADIRDAYDFAEDIE